MISAATYPCIIGSEELKTEQATSVVDPYSQKKIASVYLAGYPELERASKLAEDTWRQGASRHQRSQWLQKLASLIEDEAQDLADTIVAEAGKPIRYARGEVARAASTFSIAAAEALVFAGEEVPLDAAASGAGYFGFARQVPAGPVAAITPFNFPLNLVAHKVAPAIAVGCPVVVKPAPATPLSALKLGRLALKAGLPPGWLSVLPMDNQQAPLMLQNPHFRVLSFTGSNKVGWQLKAQAGTKKVLLELGGNAPVLVHEDANLDFAIPRIAIGGYAYSGQVCIAVQRILVHQPIYQQFLKRYVAEVSSLRVGDPSAEETVCGPMINRREEERIASWVQEAKASGARVLCGGVANSPFYQPTVLECVDRGLALVKKEAFGPVTVISPYQSFEESLARANEGEFGLQVGVFTQDISRLLSSFEKLEFGGIIVNDYPTFRVDNMPYGGVKSSGFGREGLRYAMKEMSETKLLVIRR